MAAFSILRSRVNLATLAALGAVVLGASTGGTQVGTAPDGKPGFGARASVSDVRGLFQSPSEEEQAFLGSLQALESEIRVLAARFAKSYEDAGYFGLLERRAEPTLEHLHDAWFERLAEPLPALTQGHGKGQVFARLCADLRFRSRARLLLGAAGEFRELNGALGLLRAHFAGYADLHDREVAQLGLRADVAASVLRSLRLDLEALRDDGAAEEAPLAALRAVSDGHSKDTGAVEGAQAALRQLELREEQMLGVLFSSRPSDELRDTLAWRARQRAEGERVLLEVRVLSPLTEEGRNAPPEVKQIGKSKRYEYAARAAVEGLSLDLMNEELNRLAGESIDFQWGGIESRRWFDRFLALRGIRSHDHRSYDVKTLDADERRALERVQAPVVIVPR